MGFFSRLVSSVVERAYEVADAVSDYVSEKVRRSEPRRSMGSVYLSDLAARERKVEHSRAARAAEGYPREGYQESDYTDNVIELPLETIVAKAPAWAKRPTSGAYRRTGTY
tara:strand:+ start:8658 stop:8990 length:333 start_codon:yes stop_codon:yes gene_type:complete